MTSFSLKTFFRALCKSEPNNCIAAYMIFTPHQQHFGYNYYPNIVTTPRNNCKMKTQSIYSYLHTHTHGADRYIKGHTILKKEYL